MGKTSTCHLTPKEKAWIKKRLNGKKDLASIDEAYTLLCQKQIQESVRKQLKEIRREILED